MVNWVEEVVASDVRIVCHLAAAAPIDQSPLTYVVEKNGEADRGPFATFDAAMLVAQELAAQSNMSEIDA